MSSGLNNDQLELIINLLIAPNVIHTNDNRDLILKIGQWNLTIRSYKETCRGLSVLDVRNMFMDMIKKELFGKRSNTDPSNEPTNS